MQMAFQKWISSLCSKSSRMKKKLKEGSVDRSKFLLFVISAVLFFIAGSLSFGEDVRATAAFVGSGDAFPVSDSQIIIHASYVGIIYLEGGKGALDKAVIDCPVVNKFDLNANKGEASGHCIFTAGEGNIAYSEWQCIGNASACEGDFKFTSGAGKFSGITGGSKIVIRAALSETAASLKTGGSIRGAIGLAVWPALHYDVAAK